MLQQQYAIVLRKSYRKTTIQCAVTTQLRRDRMADIPYMPFACSNMNGETVMMKTKLIIRHKHTYGSKHTCAWVCVLKQISRERETVQFVNLYALRVCVCVHTCSVDNNF